MTTCPYCNGEAMSKLKKYALGPARSVRCKSCGKKVSVGWASMWVLPALFLYFWSVFFVDLDCLFRLIILVAFIVLSAVYHLRFVQIVGREE